MPGDQIHDTLRDTQASEIARTVQRVEARIDDVGRVPDVMQPRRRDQDLADQRQRRRDPVGLGRDASRMDAATTGAGRRVAMVSRTASTAARAGS
jgi:hypothetical protein